MADSTPTEPEKIVRQLLQNDPFSRWMGIELVDIRTGFCSIRCRIKPAMLNGYQVTHGGILFSLADSALAFAFATYGYASVGIDHSISFLQKTGNESLLFARGESVHIGKKTGVGRVEITDEKNRLVVVLKGTIYRTSERLSG